MGADLLYRTCPAIRLVMRRLMLLAILVAMSSGPADAQQEALWSGVKSGTLIVLMRHARAPGIGDPDNFKLGDCSTQRNLSAAGLEQAARIGDRFRDRGITQASIFTSQWCRCRDTAEALALGPVVELPALNSFFRDFGSEESQTRALKRWISARPKAGPLVLVTHQVNITALTEVFPRSGELVFVQFDGADDVKVVGRVVTE